MVKDRANLIFAREQFTVRGGMSLAKTHMASPLSETGLMLGPVHRVGLADKSHTVCDVRMNRLRLEEEGWARPTPRGNNWSGQDN